MRTNAPTPVKERVLGDRATGYLGAVVQERWPAEYRALGHMSITYHNDDVTAR
jgi:hypothetical protein